MNEKRCTLFSVDGRTVCAACGEEWTAADRHVCPDLRRVVQQVSRVESAVLVAMLTRDAPMIDAPSGPFIRGWGGRLSRRVRDGLRERGLITPDLASRRALVLTEAGRNLALNACSPETRARYVA